jgi:hypothetical protein
MMVALALGLGASTLASIPVLSSTLACLLAGQMILRRHDSRRSRRILYFGSHEPRRAA